MSSRRVDVLFKVHGPTQEACTWPFPADEGEFLDEDESGFTDKETMVCLTHSGSAPFLHHESSSMTGIDGREWGEVDAASGSPQQDSSEAPSPIPPSVWVSPSPPYICLALALTPALHICLHRS